MSSIFLILFFTTLIFAEACLLKWRKFIHPARIFCYMVYPGARGSTTISVHFSCEHFIPSTSVHKLSIDFLLILIVNVFIIKIKTSLSQLSLVGLHCILVCCWFACSHILWLYFQLNLCNIHKIHVKCGDGGHLSLLIGKTAGWVSYIQAQISAEFWMTLTK